MSGTTTHPRAKTILQLRMATIALVSALAWDALDPNLSPHPSFVMASYFFLGFLATAAFPNRAWIGILIAIGSAVLIELLQSFVPLRDVKAVEVLIKWLCATVGVIVELSIVFWRDTQRRK
ncbi:MAG: VanZ family protein [Devosia sp.]